MLTVQDVVETPQINSLRYDLVAIVHKFVVVALDQDRLDIQKSSVNLDIPD
jgi:septum formation topological specificity factor MinE